VINSNLDPISRRLAAVVRNGL